MAYREDPNKDENPYETARRIKAEELENSLKQKGTTTVAERGSDTNIPSNELNYSDPDEPETLGGGSNSLDPHPAYAGVFDGVSDEDLGEIFDRGENTSEAEVKGVSVPIGVVSAEIARRYRADLKAEAAEKENPDAMQLGLNLGVPQPRRSLLTEIERVKEKDNEGG